MKKQKLSKQEKQELKKAKKLSKVNVGKKFGVANWLTVVRLILMVPFIALMSVLFAMIVKYGAFGYEKVSIVSIDGRASSSNLVAMSAIYWLCVVIFIAAMITDFVDGHYARKTNTVSAFGKVFDPIADKVATNLMMIFLAIVNYTYLPIVILFIVRDILVDGSRVYATKKNIKVAANWWGKAKTIIVSFALIAVAFAGPWLLNLDNQIKRNAETTKKALYIFYVNIPLIIGLILAWVSGIIYMTKYLKGIRNDFEKEVNEAKITEQELTKKQEEIFVSTDNNTSQIQEE
ncbi:CDP-diacylglycerol--glycerol-3-phosphate 3-phosphatidyltransferase [[Mycoplasma] falconis]|uniref:CDP-diacylglycerol--glycerol-3-phosphate 3-phosphatidyltransferase n=1 Tax=[Mycoplasma] falconis TaxID=92403 RepID=A0A501X7P1_9BACT|nr:CDP-diacylglycerol--glycerol-3-phosphate 3-phosphatidyltransferase [[Mycoplasma] falconis]TPE56570.1 CDP-diacylglycerol--glycerol-3-phosphate 3-phosphatidyltransferase [[Mycoplasma] falconis]